MDLQLSKQVLQILMPLLVRHLLVVPAMGVTQLVAEVWHHLRTAPLNRWANHLTLTTKVLALNRKVLTSNHSVEAVQVSELAVGKSTLLMEDLTEAIMETLWAVAASVYSPWVVKDPASSLRRRRITSQTR